MRPRATVVALVLLLGASLVCGGWAPTGKPASKPQVIRLLWLRTSIHVTGSRSSWTSRLTNETSQFGRPAGAKVGTELGFSDGSHASGVITLPGGLVQYGGRLKHHGKSTSLVIAVTGGTGSFAGATGSYTFSGGDQAHSRNGLLVIRLHVRSAGHS
jgi:hypothetical protein